MDRPLGREEPNRRRSNVPTAFQPTVFSWQQRADNFGRIPPRNPHNAEDLIRRNAVSAVDVIFALIEREVLKVREMIPRMNLAEIGKTVLQQLPAWWDRIAEFFNSILGRNSHTRAIAGKDALLDTDMLNFDRVSVADSDDFEDSISIGRSTVCTAPDNKRLAELEAQLADLRSTVATLTSALKQEQAASAVAQTPSPPPDPAKKGTIPPVSQNVPPPPPPPPPMFIKQQPADQKKDAPKYEMEKTENKENLPKNKMALPSVNNAGDFMSVLTAALKQRRKVIGSGVSTSVLEELEKPKAVGGQTGEQLACALRTAVPPPTVDLNDTQDSDWLECRDEEEDW